MPSRNTKGAREMTYVDDLRNTLWADFRRQEALILRLVEGQRKVKMELNLMESVIQSRRALLVLLEAEQKGQESLSLYRRCTPFMASPPWTLPD